MKKKIIAVFAAVASLLAFAGCNTNNDSGSASGSDSGSGAADSGNTGASSADTLTILAWESNSDITNMVKLFCEKTGTPEDKIVITRQGKDGKGGSEQYPQYLKGDGDADLMCLEADWILKFINDDTLTVPLSTIGIEESQYTDAYGYTMAIGKNEKGELRGVSFQAAPGGFVYRADLAEEYLGVKTPDEMQALVSDWDKFKDTAKKISDASGGKCSLTATEGGLWQVFQANRTKAWVVDNKLEMDTAEQFYDIAKEFKDSKYLADVPQWDTAWYAAVKDGTAMGDFVSTWGLTNSDTSILYNFTGGPDGPCAGKMAFCAGPTNYFWGGTWLGVSAKCNTNDLAKKFVEFFTVNAESMQQYTETTGDFCNNKTAMKTVVDGKINSNPLLKDGQDQFEILYSAADGIKMDGLITKYDATIKDAFNKSVQGYLDGTHETKEDAISAFKKDVKAAFPDLTVE